MLTTRRIAIIEKTRKPSGDAERERLRTAIIRLSRFEGSSLVIFGILAAAYELSPAGISSVLGFIIIGLGVVSLIGTAIAEEHYGQYDLGPEDEFETSQTLRRRDRAYGFLAYSVLILALAIRFLPPLTATGALLILLGITELIESGLFRWSDKESEDRADD